MYASVKIYSGKRTVCVNGIGNVVMPLRAASAEISHDAVFRRPSGHICPVRRSSEIDAAVARNIGVNSAEGVDAEKIRGNVRTVFGS